jgi:hypothetical protein
MTAFASNDWRELAMMGGTILVVMVMIAAVLAWLFGHSR